MNRIYTKFQMLTFSLCCLAGMATFNVMSQTTLAEEFKIGVVDINEVFDHYDKRHDLDQELKDMEKDYKTEIENKKKVMIDLNEETQLLDLGSEGRKKNMEILEKENIELEGYAKFAEKQLTKKYKDAFEKVYEEIVNEIDSFGKDNNYSVIIKKEKSNLQSNQLSDLQFKIGIRTVLYNSNAIDVTQSIIEHLNARYKNEKTKK